jgi:hypothetical protein
MDGYICTLMALAGSTDDLEMADCIGKVTADNMFCSFAGVISCSNCGLVDD